MAPGQAWGQVFVDPKEQDPKANLGSDNGGEKDTDQGSNGRRTEKRKECSKGQKRTDDTRGHCCWPGQVWSKGECRGIPTSCPTGHEIDGAKETCAAKACEGGQVRVDGVQCCWPGQAWSDGRETCVGVPQCPEGYEAHNESCVALAPFHKAQGDGTVYGTRLSIPAGEFVLGCRKDVDVDCEADEKPYNTVWLDNFELDRTEVPVSAYTKCVDAGVCTAPGVANACHWGVAGRDEFPVNCVTWSQASAFCNWAGGRLPTEAEWEKAARGSTPQLYPWGNQKASCDRAVLDGCGGTKAVGSATVGGSPYGALDMAGNVSEWTSDWYAADTYRNTLGENPSGPETGTSKVVRGGSYMDGTQAARATDRRGIDPAKAQRDLGFRCAFSTY